MTHTFAPPLTAIFWESANFASRRSFGSRVSLRPDFAHRRVRCLFGDRSTCHVYITILGACMTRVQVHGYEAIEAVSVYMAERRPTFRLATRTAQHALLVKSVEWCRLCNFAVAAGALSQKSTKSTRVLTAITLCEIDPTPTSSSRQTPA